MAIRQDPLAPGSRPLPSNAFLEGLESSRADDWEAALECFRVADEDAAPDDVYQNRYSSFHGLARVLTGDSHGVKLCRKAAAGEMNDADVFYNLAMAEHRLGNREGAYTAFSRGLKIDADHPGLQRLEGEFTLRERRSLFPGLKRKSFLNQFLGRLLRGTRRPWEDQD